MVKELELWREIEDLGWTKDHDYVRIGVQLVKSKRKDEIEKFTRTKVKELYKILDAAYTGGSDDMFDDLCYHIVGAGKKVFDAVLKDPTSCNQVRPRESFAYCFNLDPAELDPAVYLSRLIEFMIEHAGINDKDYIDSYLIIVKACREVCDRPCADSVEFLKTLKRKARDQVDHRLNRSGWQLSNIVNDLVKYAKYFPKYSN